MTRTSTAMNPVGGRGYIRELDGLRALAIVGVLAFHFEVPGGAIGWTGVILFFALSGFLITRILLNVREERHYFRNFYIRRSLRIFPIYYLVIIALFAIPMFGRRQWDLLGYLPFYLTYTQSYPITHWQPAGLGLLFHTWTLAVEEQFYLAWPIVVLLLGARKLRWAALTLMIVTPCIRQWLVGVNLLLAYNWLPGAMDSLAAGALLAAILYLSPDPRNAARRLGYGGVAIGLIATVGLALWTGGPSQYGRLELWVNQGHNFFFLPALSLFFAGLIALAAASARWLAWLGHPVMVHIGRRSYGVYLYHHPMVFWLFRSSFFTRLAPSHLVPALAPLNVPWIEIPVKMAIIYGVACASWRWIESPILAMKDRIAPSKAEAGQKAEARQVRFTKDMAS